MCFRISIPTFYVDQHASPLHDPRWAQRTGGSARDVLVQFEIGGTDGCIAVAMMPSWCLEFKHQFDVDINNKNGGIMEYNGNATSGIWLIDILFPLVGWLMEPSPSFNNQ